MMILHHHDPKRILWWMIALACIGLALYVNFIAFWILLMSAGDHVMATAITIATGLLWLSWWGYRHFWRHNDKRMALALWVYCGLAIVLLMILLLHPGMVF